MRRSVARAQAGGVRFTVRIMDVTHPWPYSVRRSLISSSRGLNLKAMGVALADDIDTLGLAIRVNLHLPFLTA